MLSLLYVGRREEENYVDVIRWERYDQRVTHDILRLKCTSDHLCIEHENLGEMQKVTIKLRSVMGCELSVDKLTVDVFEPPVSQVKDGNHWKTTNDDSPSMKLSSPSLTQWRVQVVANPKRHDLLTLLSEHPFLQNALQVGLQMEYHCAQEKNLHEFFPLIQDPTLVRAAQIAVSTLLEDNNDVEAAIKLFRGLFLKFQSLLSQRQKSKEE